MVSKTRRAEVLTLWSGEMRQLVTGPYFKMVSKVRVAPRATQVIDVCGSMGAARTKRMSQEGKERRKTSNWVTSWSREKLVRAMSALGFIEAWRVAPAARRWQEKGTGQGERRWSMAAPMAS